MDYEAHQALCRVAKHREQTQKAFTEALTPSRTGIRHQHQRVQKKPRTALWFCATLTLSAAIGVLLAY